MTITPYPAKKMTEESFYSFLGKIDAFNGQYIGGTKGMRTLIKRLNIRKDPDFKVLEIGAATGYTSCLIAQEYGCSVTSTDISPVLVEKARQRAERLGLTNMEFKVADAMNLDFPDNTFDIVYGLAITGLLPDKLKALNEYTRVVKPGGTIGGLEMFPKGGISPEVDKALTAALTKIMGTGGKVFNLDEWNQLFSETGLYDIEVTSYYEDVFENPPLGLNTIKTYLKLVYYLITNSWFRTMFFEVMDLRKQVTKTSDDIFKNVGYLIYTAQKQET